MKIRRLSSGDQDFQEALADVLAWDLSEDSRVDQIAKEIILKVRAAGDAAVLGYTEELDGLTVDSVGELEISAEELQAALAQVDDDQRRALEGAAERIRSYHQQQLQDSWEFTDPHGNQLGQRVTALDRVGVYVPGGQASYPSSVLMTLIPAKVAGVEELIVTVPTPNGERNTTVLAALAVAGADRVFTVGGAQAIAALAYGTESIPRVDKIVGPGGAFVAAAKKQVFGQVGIDLIAGPSEVCIIADKTANAEWTAWDLFSQAEHDADAQAILISDSPELLAAVHEHMSEALPKLKRAEIAAASLQDRGALIQVEDMAEAVQVANQIAPEHLELHVAEPEALLPEIKHAGAIFCGSASGESFGDYVAGPSHVLPTFGTARFASPLGVYDFQKRSSVIKLSDEGAAVLADLAVTLAESEGLEAHARAAALRASQN